MNMNFGIPRKRHSKSIESPTWTYLMPGLIALCLGFVSVGCSSDAIEDSVTTNPLAVAKPLDKLERIKQLSKEAKETYEAYQSFLKTDEAKDSTHRKAVYVKAYKKVFAARMAVSKLLENEYSTKEWENGDFYYQVKPGFEWIETTFEELALLAYQFDKQNPINKK